MAFTSIPRALQQVYLGTDISALQGAQSQTLSGGTVYLYVTDVVSKITVTGFRYRSGNAATSFVNGAVYTLDGNIVAGSDTGAITNNSTTTNVVFTYPTAFSLDIGTYMIAFAPGLSTDTFLALSTPTGGELLSRLRTATNTVTGVNTSSQAMPLTTGAFIGSGSSKLPAFSFPLSGGI